MKRICCLILLLYLCHTVRAQQRVELNGQPETIYPLSIVEDTLTSLLPVKDLFSSKRVVALGEATHGTQEFMTLRIAMLKFLITHCDYRSVILEASFGATLDLDDYVTGSPGDADSLLRRVGYWMFYAPEFRNFVHWVRTYNRGKPVDSKVHIWGMDMQTLLDPLLYIDRKSASLPADARAGFDAIVQPFLRAHHQAAPAVVFNATDSMRTAITATVRKLRQWVKDQEPALEAVYTKAGAGIWQLCVKNIDYALRLPGNHSFYRDSCMANNVVELTNLLQQRSTVWAHDLHISRYDSLVNNPSLRNMMGRYLDQVFHDQYYPVGFLFEKGQFLALEGRERKSGRYYPHFKNFHLPPVTNNKLPGRLSSLTKGASLVDLSNSSNAIWHYPHAFHLVGSIYGKKWVTQTALTPAALFAGVVFVPTTSGIVQIDDYFNKTAR